MQLFTKKHPQNKSQSVARTGEHTGSGDGEAGNAVRKHTQSVQQLTNTLKRVLFQRLRTFQRLERRAHAATSSTHLNWVCINTWRSGF